MSLANASFRAVGVVSLFCDFFLTSVDLSGAMDQGKERIRLLDGIPRIGYTMAPRDITYTLVVSWPTTSPRHTVNRTTYISGCLPLSGKENGGGSERDSFWGADGQGEICCVVVLDSL
jgi:hypothetical protein